MSNKHRIKQLNNVILVLKENHQKEIANLARVQQAIARKMESVNRIIAYRAEYEKMYTTNMNMRVPVLMKNMAAFIKKLDVAIVEEKNVIDTLEGEKKHIIIKVEELDKKIRAIISKHETLQLNERIKLENREAAVMDDINGTKKSRETA